MKRIRVFNARAFGFSLVVAVRLIDVIDSHPKVFLLRIGIDAFKKECRQPCQSAFVYRVSPA